MGNSLKRCCFALTNIFNNKNNLKGQMEPFIKINQTQKHYIFKNYNGERRINKEVSLYDFRIIKTLGKGSFGKVVLVQHLELKTYYAMKILVKEQIKQFNQVVHTKSEREILEKISHPFIIKLVFAFQNPEKLFIITEYMCGGDIFYHLQKARRFSEERTRFYLCEIILALEYLHAKQIIYRDLKPENILLDKQGHIKLTDFGLSKILTKNLAENNNEDSNYDISHNIASKNSSFLSASSRAYTICGTPEYLAPEILLGKGYTRAVDWWSLGIVAYEMLCGYSPFHDNKYKLDINVYKNSIKKEKYLSNNAFDLLENLLKIDPNARLGSGEGDAEEIKNHPFFKGIKWKDVFEKKYKPGFIPNIKNEEDLSNFDKMFTDEDPKSIGMDKKNLFVRQNSENKYDDFTYVNKFLT